MISWTGLAPWEFESPFSGSLTSIYLAPPEAPGLLDTPHLSLDQNKNVSQLVRPPPPIASEGRHAPGRVFPRRSQLGSSLSSAVCEVCKRDDRSHVSFKNCVLTPPAKGCSGSSSRLFVSVETPSCPYSITYRKTCAFALESCSRNPLEVRCVDWRGCPEKTRGRLLGKQGAVPLDGTTMFAIGETGRASQLYRETG